MKKTILTFILTVLCFSCAQAQFIFGGNDYSMKWEASQGDANMKEYLVGTETTENWTTMLTLQAHPKATEVKQVSAPYFEARKSIVAMQPQLHPKEEGDFTDVVLELLLGGPGITPHLEFVLARFIQTEKGVYMITYSHKIPLKSKKKNQDINIDHIANGKEAWIKELLNIPVESITKEF
jgi:hypothetical protein